MFRVTQRYLVSVVAFFGIFEGIIGAALYYGSLPLFVYHFNASVYHYQRALALFMQPWSYRGVVSLVLNHYSNRYTHVRKRVVQATCIGLALCLIGITVAPNVTVVTALFSLASTMIMVTNTVFEGDTVARIKTMYADTTLLQFARGAVMVGACIGVIMVGVSSNIDADKIIIVYGMCVPLVLPLLWMMQYDDLIDIAIPWHPAHRLAITPAVATSLLLVCIAASAHPLALAFVSVLVTAFTATHIVVVYKHRPVLLGIALFGFLHEIFYVEIAGAIDIFYTSGPPGFSMLFYIPYSKLISNVMTVLALFVYSRYDFSSARRVVLFAGCTRVASAFTDISIGSRWNLDAGISDETAFVFGDPMLGAVGSALIQVALMVALSNELDENDVVTTPVVLALQSAGKTISRVLGMLLVHAYGIEHDDYTGYVPLLVLAHVVLPLFSMSLAFGLLNGSADKRD
jgi:hypothetical protein